METKNTRDLITISLAFFFAFLGAGASQPFVVSYLNEAKGLSLTQASLVLSMVYFTFVVFRFFIGFIIDVTGLHLAKILGVAMYALFPFVVYAGGSLPIWLAGSVLWGIGAPMLWTGALVQVMNTSAPTRYATATGIIRGTVMAAAFIGLYLLSFIYARRGYEALFLFAAVCGVAAILAMLCSPNRHVPREKPNLRKFLEVMRSHEAKTVTAFLVCSGVAYGVLLNGFKSHIEIHCGTEWLKAILPFFSLAGILASFIGGRICDRVGRWKTFGWGFTVGAVGLLLAWHFTHPAVLMLAMFLIGVQFAIVPLSGFAWVGDRTSPSDRASVMGYVFCFRDLGVAVAIQLRGMVASVTTALLAFAIISILCAAAAFAISRSAAREKR